MIKILYLGLRVSVGLEDQVGLKLCKIRLNPNGLKKCILVIGKIINLDFEYENQRHWGLFISKCRNENYAARIIQKLAPMTV